MAKLWDKIGSKVHLGLGAAGMIPGIGNIADLIDAGIYTAEGDKLGAGLSLAAAVPGMGLVAGGTKLLKGAKGVKSAKSAKKVTSPEGFKKLHQELTDKYGKATSGKDKYGWRSKYNPLNKYGWDTSTRKGGVLVRPAKEAKQAGLELLDPQMVKKSRTQLKKELLSEESYGKWVKMMTQSRANRVVQLEKLGAPKTLVDNMIKAPKLDVSKKTYNKIISKQIDETPVFIVPEKHMKRFSGKDSNPLTMGWYKAGKNTGAVFIPEYTLGASRGFKDWMGNPKLASTVLHELKHATQAPFKSQMGTAYEGMLHGLNRDFRRRKQGIGMMQEVMSGARKNVPDVKMPLPPAKEYTRYVRTPHETSARLSEIRSGLPTGAKDELMSVFDPRKMDWLDKNVWGAAPIALMTGKQRFDKAFGEEKGE